MKVQIELTYKTLKGAVAEFKSDLMSPEAALLITTDLEKTNRVKRIAYTDDRDRTWTVKELTKLLEQIETEPHHIKVYFDGGYEQHTKRSGLGIVIYYEQDNKSYRIRKNALVDLLDSNNEAEYAALHLAIVELAGLGVKHQTVQFIGDSKVVINQLLGEWACFEDTLNNWADKIEEKFTEMDIEPAYSVIARTQNKEADQLATKALNNKDVSSCIEIEK